MGEEQRYYYAQLDENGVCCGVSDLVGEIEDGSMIQLESYDVSVLGKKYENGLWVTVEVTAEPEVLAEEQPTNAELQEMILQVQEQNLILMEVLAEMYESNM